MVFKKEEAEVTKTVASRNSLIPASFSRQKAFLGGSRGLLDLHDRIEHGPDGGKEPAQRPNHPDSPHDPRTFLVLTTEKRLRRTCCWEKGINAFI